MKKDPKIIIATPTLHDVKTLYFESMMKTQSKYPVSYTMEIGSLVYMARNRLVKTAVQYDFDYILWIDSDMVFKTDAVAKMIEYARQGKHFVTGMYFTRALPVKPVVMKEIIWERNEDGTIKHGSTPYYDYPKDSLFQVAGCGFGFCLTSVEMIGKTAQANKRAPFDPFPSLGEDYTFCWQAAKQGYQCWCDSGIKVGHVGEIVYTEDMYLATRQEAAKQQ